MYINPFSPFADIYYYCLNDKIYFLKNLKNKSISLDKLYILTKVEDFNCEIFLGHQNENSDKHYRYQKVTILDDNNKELTLFSTDESIRPEINLIEKLNRYNNVKWLEAEFDIITSLEYLIVCKKELIDLINNEEKIINDLKESLKNECSNAKNDEIKKWLFSLDEEQRVKAKMTRKEWNEKKVLDKVKIIKDAPKEIIKIDQEIILYSNYLKNNINKSNNSKYIIELTKIFEIKSSFNFERLNKTLIKFIQSNINYCYEKQIHISGQGIYDCLKREENTDNENSIYDPESIIMGSFKNGTQDKYGY